MVLATSTQSERYEGLLFYVTVAVAVVCLSLHSSVGQHGDYQYIYS